MKSVLRGFAVLTLTTAAAHAGGLDRSGQSISSIFETGSYAELSFGVVQPSIEGVMLGLPLPSGNVAPDYLQFGIAAKMDVNDKVSLGLIFDQPYGAKVSYETAGYPLNTTNAEVKTQSLTLIGRYKLNDAFSVHAGVRSVTASGHYDPVGPYASTYSAGTDSGYLVGVAFEKPEIAMRVALTYASETHFALDGTAGDLTATMPASVNLDVQSGIAANTLLFGSVRWADWTSATIDDSLAGNLVDYASDTVTYSLGVGRKFSDTFSGAVTLGYEAGDGELASNLSPTDGQFSIGLGGTYTRGNMKVTGGVRYVKVGDTTTESVGAFPGASFTGNSAVGVGVKVAFSF